MKKLLILFAILMFGCSADEDIIQENCYCNPDVKQESRICRQVCGVFQDL